MFLWASGFVGIRAAGSDLSPGALALLRLGIASLVLTAIVLVRRERLPDRSGLQRAVVCGIAWFGAYNVLLNAGEQRVDAGTAAMVVNLGPVLIALGASRLLGEGLPRRLMVGSLLAFAGVCVIAGATTQADLEPLGVGLCVAAAVAYAGGVLVQKPALAGNSALSITWVACLAGAVATLPWAPSLGHEIGAVPTSSVVWAVYLGVVPTGLGFLTWGYALARTSAGRAASLTYLVPAVAIVQAWLFLGETPPALALLGGALTLAGVSVARRRSGAAAPAERALSLGCAYSSVAAPARTGEPSSDTGR